jgi:hypothetical protein
VRDRYNHIERVPKDAFNAIDAELKRYDLMHPEGKVHPMGTVTFAKMLSSSEAKEVTEQYVEKMKKKAVKKARQSKTQKSKGPQ